MGKIFMVTLDVQPVPPSLDWLVWVLRPKGDMDSNLHRHTYEVARLDEINLALRVEKLIGLSISPVAD